VIIREEAISALAGFHAGPRSRLVELEFGDIRFRGGRKREPGEKP